MQGPFLISQLPEHLKDLDPQKLVELHALVKILGRPVRDGGAIIAVISGEEEIGVTITTDPDCVRMSVGLDGITPEEDMCMIFLSADASSYVLWDQRISLKTLDAITDAYRKALEEAGQVT